MLTEFDIHAEKYQANKDPQLNVMTTQELDDNRKALDTPPSNLLKDNLWYITNLGQVIEYKSTYWKQSKPVLNKHDKTIKPNGKA